MSEILVELVHGIASCAVPEMLIGAARIKFSGIIEATKFFRVEAFENPAPFIKYELEGIK